MKNDSNDETTTATQDIHPSILDAVSAMRAHAEELNALDGEYYGAFPPTAEEREELIEVFASKLRDAGSS